MRSHKTSAFMSLAICFLSICFILLTSPHGYSQGARQQDKSYRILTGDVLEIFIEGAPEFDGYYAVKSNGRFLMPYLKCVAASGKTTDELAAFIADQLRGRYLKEPVVRVAVLILPRESNGRHITGTAAVSIYGAVNAPGDYYYREGMTIKDVLIIARGVTPNAQNTGYIVRHSSDDCGEIMIPFNVVELINENKDNSPLQPGDEIFIPSNPRLQWEIIKPLRPSPRFFPRPSNPPPAIPKTGPFGSIYALNQMRDNSFDEREIE